MSNTLNFVLASPNKAADHIDELETRLWQSSIDLKRAQAALREIKDQHLTPEQSHSIAKAALAPEQDK